MTMNPQASKVSDGTNIFIVVEGVRIARRGSPGTPQARTWVSLEPGWEVLDGQGGTLIVTYNDVRAH
jgi:hypothetical protein